MQLSLAQILTLAAACAPDAAPQTLAAIATVESTFRPLAIGVNGAGSAGPMRDAAEAVTTARDLIAAGRSVDLGLAQINSANLGWLGLSVEAAFDPCRNLQAAGRVLRAGYAQALARGETGPDALRTALSIYNTGDPARGRRNGYVAKVEDAAARLALLSQAPTSPAPPTLTPAIAAPSPPQRWDIFARHASDAFVQTPVTTGDAP